MGKPKPQGTASFRVGTLLTGIANQSLMMKVLIDPQEPYYLVPDRIEIKEVVLGEPVLIIHTYKSEWRYQDPKHP